MPDGFTMSLKNRLDDILKNKKILYPFLLGIFFVFLLLNNYHWLMIDNSIPLNDYPDHLRNAYKYYHLMKSGNFRFFVFPRDYPPYPTLAYQISSLFFLLFGRNMNVAVLSQSVFWLILIYSVYYIGEKIWGENVGFLAALSSITPLYIINNTQAYRLDLPCSAMVALSLMCLIKSDVFEKPGWTIAFFVASGLAMIVKWAFAFFLIIPFLFYFIKFIKRSFKEKLSFILTLILLIGIAVSACFMMAYNYRIHITLITSRVVIPLYLKNIAVFFAFLIIATLLPIKDLPQKRFAQGVSIFFIIVWHCYGLSVEQVFNYIQTMKEAPITEGILRHTPLVMSKLLIMDFIGVVRTFFLIIGLIWYFGIEKKTPAKNAIMAGFIGSVIILFNIQYKDLRYLIPLIPFIALLTTYWIFQVEIKSVRIPIICIFALLIFLGATGWRFEKLMLPLEETDLGRKINYQCFVSRLPDKRQWKFREVGEKIEKYTKGKGSVVLIHGSGPFTAKSYEYFTTAYAEVTGKLMFRTFNFLGAPGFDIQEDWAYYYLLLPDNIPDIEREDEERWIFYRYHPYSNLIILNFHNKKSEKSRRNYMDNLKGRGFRGDVIPLETIELPEDNILEILQMKVDPVLPWNSITPWGTETRKASLRGWSDKPPPPPPGSIPTMPESDKVEK